MSASATVRTQADSPGRRTTSGTSRAPLGSTPSMSPITAIGSGAAMSRTKSHSPRSHTASISVSHSAADRRLLVLHPLAGEAGVDELAPQQMCGIVHVDHHRQARLIGTDAAGVGEQLGIALGVDHGLIGRRGGQPVAVPEHRLVGRASTVRRDARVVGVESAVGQIHVRLRRRSCHRDLLGVAERHLTLSAELDTSARFGKPSDASSFA